MRQRIIIQQVVANKWVTFNTVWAAVQPVTGAEVARQEEPTTTLKSNVIIRYLAGIKPKFRITFGTRVLEIQSVINVNEDNHEMNLVCNEVVN